MRIQDKIEKIREKPEHIRVRYAWGMAVFFTLIVVIIWITSLVVPSGEETEKESIISSEPMEDLKKDANSMGEAASKIKKSVEAQSKQTVIPDGNGPKAEGEGFIPGN